MNSLIRFYNQNRKTIFIVIASIIGIIAILQGLNYLSEKKSEKKLEELSKVNSGSSSTTIYQPSKSSISSTSVSEKTYKEQSTVIDKFIEYCNVGNYTEAYNLISDECKEEMFPKLEDFINTYYKTVFGSKKTYYIQNWIGNTYKISITNDILATGKVEDSKTIVDYYTIVKNNDEQKLNINNFIGKRKINTAKEEDGIKITVKNSNIHMEYIKYDLEITNMSNSNIYMDTLETSKSIFITDGNGNRYFVYNNEIIRALLDIKIGETKSLSLKFSSAYVQNKEINSLTFLRVITNYDNYMQNKEEYKEFKSIKIDI
ncbi:MAG: hypothetical protein IKT41_03745 [Clostridia bacterium]|nr:hypothetical protein [Clostridia bacterium]